MGKLQFVHTKALEAISKYLSTFSTTSIHTPVVVLSFFSRSFSFSSFLLKKKRTYIVKKKEKRVEKWITLGARSVVGEESRGGRLLDHNRGCCKKIKAVKADLCGKGQQKWVPLQARSAPETLATSWCAIKRAEQASVARWRQEQQRSCH